MADAPTMEVRARLSADTAQFMGPMRTASQAAEQFGASASRLTSTLNAMGLASAAIGGGLIALGVKSFNAAARVQELDVALQSVGWSTGKGYEALAATATAIKQQGIEMEVAQRATLKFAQNNLDMAKASEVARVAQDLAVIGAMNSTDAFDMLTHAIITGRSEVLKSVGIQKSAGQAYAEYARSIGKTAQSLSYEEKQAAVLNMVLKEGARVAGTYEAAMQTPSKVLRSFPRLINNIQVAMGDALLKGFGPMIFESYELFKKLVKATEGTGAFHDVITAVTKVVVKLTEPVAKFIKGLGDWIDKFDALKINTDKLAQSLSFIGPAALAAMAGLATFAGRGMLQNLPIFGSYFANLKVFPIMMLVLVATSTKVREAFINLGKALSPLLGVVKTVAGALANLGGYAVGLLAKSLNGLAALIRNVIGFFQQHAAVAKVLAVVMGAVAAAILATVVYLQVQKALAAASAAIMGVYTFAMIAFGVAETSAAAGSVFLTSGMQALAVALAETGIPEIVLAVVALGAAFIYLWKTSEGFRNAISATFNTVAQVVGKALGFVLKTIGYVLIAYANLMDTNNSWGRVVANVYNFVWQSSLTMFIGIVKLIKFVLDAFINLMTTHNTFRKVVETVINVVIRIFALMVTEIITMAANIIKGIATIIHYFETFLEVGKAIVKGVIGAFFYLGKGVLGILGNVASWIGGFLSDSLANIKEWVTNFLGLLMKIPPIRGLVNLAFSGMESATAKAGDALKALGTKISGVFTGTEDSTQKSVDAITGVSNTLIKNSKSWGNYTDGVAGSLSTIANKMLEFNQGIVQFAAKDNGSAIVEGLISGAQKASDALGIVISKMEDMKDIKIGDFIVQGVSDTARKAGEFILGLAGNIENFLSGDVLGKLSNGLGDFFGSMKESLGFGDIIGDAKKTFGTAFGSGADNTVADAIQGQADKMKAIREAMQAGIDSIKQVMTDLQSAAADMAKSLKDTIVGFAGLKGIELPDGFIPQAKSLIENMRSRLDKTQQFATQIAQLQSYGLDASALKDIIDQGPIKGAQIAASILGGDAAQNIAQINALQKAIQFSGAAIGQYGADAAYSGLMANAQNRYDELVAAQMSVQSAGNNIAIEQGAFVVNVDVSKATNTDEQIKMITEAIQYQFQVLAKELASK